MKLKPGDVVRLKSGGPPMTVEDCPFLNTVRCRYFKTALVDGCVTQIMETQNVPMVALKRPLWRRLVTFWRWFS